MRMASKVILARENTKDRFMGFVGNGRTADRAINDLLDIAGVPK